ncbi:Component of gems protein 1 [Hondaea fermentalgiana]|uniref:Component of gems protein 1 n=1 Tax=Hondaea fermentalgiana TaxID=2315210 RepID=A0A2R5G4V8_9STRA|nr:Component of gems protein 1 [Hondaea fermentalgiana]|eukprot:GBG26057.1 Component of gems protein 1 [Hondaea fermentalgiana]
MNGEDWDDSAIVGAFQRAVDAFDSDPAAPETRAQTPATGAAAPQPGPWVSISDERHGRDHDERGDEHDHNDEDEGNGGSDSADGKESQKQNRAHDVASDSSFVEKPKATKRQTKGPDTTHSAPPAPASMGLVPPSDDPELAALLMSWYYAGYQTGRYEAIQESRLSMQGARKR